MQKLMLALLVTLGSIGVLHADLITFTITPSGGQSLYQFTLTNTGATGGPLFDLFLSLPTDIANIDTPTIGTPVGWGDPTDGLLFFGPDVSSSTSFIDWVAEFSGAGGAFDIGIGNSLSGFSFRATQAIEQPIKFAVNGSTSLEAAQDVTAIPEPGTWGLVLIATLLIGQPMMALLVRFKAC
jgi:hypothetical protein